MLQVNDRNDRNDHNMIFTIFIVSYNDLKLPKYRLDRFDRTNMYQLRQTTKLCTQGDFILSAGARRGQSRPRLFL